MDLGLQERVFVVTAASGGLGRATAEVLVAEGARVLLVARRTQVLEQVAEQLNAGFSAPRAVPLSADLADETTGDRACATAVAEFGRLDGALVSVGGPPAGSVADTTTEQWRGAFESVFLPALWVTDAVLEHGTADDLAIGWVLSTSVKSPVAGLAASNGLRPGLGMLVKQLADELGPQGTPAGRADAGPGLHQPGAAPGLAACGPGRGPGGGGGGHPAAPVRATGGVRPGRGLRALPRRLLPHRLCAAGRGRRPAVAVTRPRPGTRR